MIRHDLHCTACDYEVADQFVEAGCYGACPLCNASLTWTPRAFVTDVHGAVQSSPVLCEPGQPGVDLTWTSTRERDQKMLRGFGARPQGDPVHGARTAYAPLGARSVHFGSRGNLRTNRSAQQRKET